MIAYREHHDTVSFDVVVQPRAPRTELVGELDGALKIRLAAPPIEGRANEALLRFLAGLLGVRRADVLIAAGQKSRRKRVRVTGLNGQQLVERLQPHLLGMKGSD